MRGCLIATEILLLKRSDEQVFDPFACIAYGLPILTVCAVGTARS